MQRRTKLIVGCLTVVLALAAAVGTATARRLEVSEQHFLALFSNDHTEREGGATFSCKVNLEGSFHSRTISKVSGQLIGYITEAIVNRPCSLNEAWLLNGVEVLEGVVTQNTLPWHMRYLKFEGMLPSITGIEVGIVNFSQLARQGTVQCLWASTGESPMRAIFNVGAGGKITALTLNEAFGIPKHAGNMLCQTTFFPAGSGPVGTQSTWREIIVRLVA